MTTPIEGFTSAQLRALGISPTKDGVLRNSTTVDINAVYGVQPGSDITTLLQTLLNKLSPGDNLDIVISVPGTYTVNGALQGGTASVSGTDASGAATTKSYAYSGSVLIPPVAWDGNLATVVRFRSACKLAFGDPANGDSGQGVTISTTQNVAGGYIFAAVPYSAKYGYAFTGVMMFFEGIAFSHPNDPQGGSINIETCLRGSIENVVCKQGMLSPSSARTGTTEAIILPQSKSNGFVMVRDVQIRGWGKGIRLSEHGVLDNVDISYTNSAFTCAVGGHANWFGYVDVEECGTIFDMTAAAGLYSTLIVNGSLDIENVAGSTSSFAPTNIANIPAGCGLLGNLDLTCNPGGGLGILGAGVVKIALNNTIDSRKYANPIDTFARLQGTDLPSGMGPGLTWPTLDAWRVLNGSFKIASGALYGTGAGSNQAFLPVRDGIVGGASRRVQMEFTTPAGSYSASLIGDRQQTGTLCVWAQATGGNIVFGIGTGPGNGTITTISGAVAASTAYRLSLDLFNVGGTLVRVDVRLNGTLLYSHACSAAQQITAAGNDPYMMDGVYIQDTTTKITAFKVMPLDAAPAGLTSGTATLAAGTVNVALPNITANSIIRLNRQAAGGTTGQLSVTLTAGTGFAINSSSNTDTSAVFWEVVSI